MLAQQRASGATEIGDAVEEQWKNRVKKEGECMRNGKRQHKLDLCDWHWEKLLEDSEEPSGSVASPSSSLSADRSYCS
jgi:hypothetical protein